MDEKKSTISKNLPYLILLIVVVGLLAAGYYHLTKTSTQTANKQNSGSTTNNGFGSGRFGNGQHRGNFKPVQGTIQTINGTTIVIKLSDSTTKTITTDSSTRIMDFDNGQRSTLSLSNLTVGETINVLTSDSSQATIQAQVIFIGTPSFGGQNNNQAPSNPSSDDSTNSG